MDLGFVTAPSGARFTVANQYADKFRGLLSDLEAAGYGIKGDQSGGYNPRNIAGTNTPSRHAYGAAIDVNWTDNPRGGMGNIPSDLARSLAQKHGLVWGGDWKNPDPMHFEVPGQPGHTYGDGHNHGTPAVQGQQQPTAARGAVPMADQMSGPNPSFLQQLLNPTVMAGLAGLESAWRGGSASEGMQTGLKTGLAQQTALQQQAQKAAVAKMLNNPESLGNLPPALVRIAQATGDVGPLAAFITKQADPNAALERDTAAVRLQGMREDLAYNREIAPYKRRQIEAQIRQLEQKDATGAIIADLLKGAMGTQGTQPPASAQPQTAPPGGFQPQSFVPGAQPGMQPGADPFLIPTQAGEMPPSGAVPAQPAPAQPAGILGDAPETVPTPLGPRTIDQSQKLGLALALAGKGDAGKIFIDAANANRLDKTARGEVEKDLVGLTNTIGRLESISKRFDPKFLNIPERAGMAWAGLQDKFGSLKPETKADLERYTKFRQTAVQNAALYVKYLSGVAVAEAEFNRIMKTLPNAGTGIFDGDSPTEFQAKMNEATTQAKMAYARAMYLRTQGFRGKPWEAGIALDDMGDIIRQRGAELQQQLQGRIAPDRMQTTVRQKLKQEFGI